MTQVVGTPSGSTTLAALLLRPGLPDTPPGPAASNDRGHNTSDRITFSAEARQRADLAEQTVTTLEAGGAWRSAAAFGWLLHQRLLDLLAADVRQTSGGRSGPSIPPRGGRVGLAA